jgi:hypothetical protein
VHRSSRPCANDINSESTNTTESKTARNAHTNNILRGQMDAIDQVLKDLLLVASRQLLMDSKTSVQQDQLDQSIQPRPAGYRSSMTSPSRSPSKGHKKSPQEIPIRSPLRIRADKRLTAKFDTGLKIDGETAGTRSSVVRGPDSYMDTHLSNSEYPIIARLTYMAELRKNVDNHGIENFLQAAFYYYLKATIDLETKSDVVSKEVYLSLVKSSWIVSNLVRR